MEGWQVWQALVGFDAPGAYTPPSMSHCVLQPPSTQTAVPPQLVPSAAGLHATRLTSGWQDWHGLAGFEAPAAAYAASM